MAKNKYLISVCIPTFNRAKNLDKNLHLLDEQIRFHGLVNKVEIIVSNNCSTDETAEILTNFHGLASITILTQSTNIGGEKNILTTIKASTADYIMLLGDDDYLESSYLLDCVNSIEKHQNLGCIIPNYQAYDPENDKLLYYREPNCQTQYYYAGFEACLENSWRAHQLSGLTFRREGVYEAYVERGLCNLYPQIFFIAYNALKYDVLHFGHSCLRVSEVQQDKKFWSYTDDLLMEDIYENYLALPLSSRQIALLEYHFLEKQPRYKLPHFNTNLAIEKILSGKNTTILGKYYLSRLFLKEQCYSGKVYRLRFYLLARLVLLKKLICGEAITF